jgi:hypothetical protein
MTAWSEHVGMRPSAVGTLSGHGKNQRLLAQAITEAGYELKGQ